jgi:hypothetical protein
MTNIIEFKPKAAEGAEPPKVAPNKYYWLEDLHMAAAYAGLVSRDIDVLKLLTEAKYKMLAEGKALTRLPLDVRTQCGAYLGGTREERKARIQSVIEAIYSRK